MAKNTSSKKDSLDMTELIQSELNRNLKDIYLRAMLPKDLNLTNQQFDILLGYWSVKPNEQGGQYSFIVELMVR